jgi:hypothetical protein
LLLRSSAWLYVLFLKAYRYRNILFWNKGYHFFEKQRRKYTVTRSKYSRRETYTNMRAKYNSIYSALKNTITYTPHEKKIPYITTPSPPPVLQCWNARTSAGD